MSICLPKKYKTNYYGDQLYFGCLSPVSGGCMMVVHEFLKSSHMIAYRHMGRNIYLVCFYIQGALLCLDGWIVGHDVLW